MSHFDMTKLNQSFKRLLPQVKLNARELLKRTAKGFVKTVVSITPPAGKGLSGTAARKAGEATIDVDTSVTMEVMSDAELSALQEFHGGTSHAATELRNKKGEVYLRDMNFIIRSPSEALAFHQRKRNKSTGRPSHYRKNGRTYYGMRRRDAGAHNQHVGRSRGDDVALVPKSVRDAVRKTLYKDVGELAAGWNASAAALGVRLPAFVKRHGDKHGSMKVVITEKRIRLELENAVPFVGNVHGYERRVQKAVDIQAAKMDREADFLMKKAIRSAGF
jgi:hypothetical protein